MEAWVGYLDNYFDPSSKRVVELRRPRRIRALVPIRDKRCPIYAVLNGRPVLRKEWGRKLRDGDRLLFVRLPRGGGGGGQGGGSNPLATVLSLALMAFAPMASSALLGAFGLKTGYVLFGSLTLGQATQLGVILAGQALVNSLFPTPNVVGLSEASPTYSLSAQGNSARIEQAIPVQYGRVGFYPDLASQPYSEFQGNNQFLYQLFCLGQGEFDVEGVYIEDTPISSFSEIDYEVVAPGEVVGLFPASVTSSLEVSGQELKGRFSGTWSRSGTTTTITETAHGRAVGQAIHCTFTTGTSPPSADAFSIVTVIDANSYTITTASGSSSGNVLIRPVVGGVSGFVASEPGSVANKLGLDFVMPRGLYATSGSSLTSMSLTVIIQTRRIDELGAPITSWTNLATEVITDRTNSPVQRSFSYTLATPGRYSVRVYRSDVKSTTPNQGHEVIWTGLRAYLEDDNLFGNITLLAVKMKATDNLSLQASRRVKVVATRKVPVWNGSSWSSPQASRSIAWAIADAARNSEYGAALPDFCIDLQGLLDLDAVWTSRGDSFDGRFETSLTWWDAVSKIAFVGRAKPYMQGRVLHVVRDGPDDFPVQMFNMRNIVKGSFAIDFLFPTSDSADQVEITFLDGATWVPRKLRSQLGNEVSLRPASLDGFGFTQAAQVLREANYHAACNRYRRRIVKFSTGREGLIATFGSTVVVSHSLMSWGQTVEVVSWNASSKEMRVSEPVDFQNSSEAFILIRGAKGDPQGPYKVTPGSVSKSLIVVDNLPEAPVGSGGNRERTFISFGLGVDWVVKAKILRVKPSSGEKVDIEAVCEDPSVHVAEDGILEPPVLGRSLPSFRRQAQSPVVSNIWARVYEQDDTMVALSWSPAPGAEFYQVEVAEGFSLEDTVQSWTRVLEVSSSNATLSIPYPAGSLVRVRGVGLVAGPWRAASIGTLAGLFWTSDTANFWTADGNLMWST